MNTINMFGKAYNTIGSSDSNFIIKTKGDLKVLWGGKYIDIIKNGKIVSTRSDIFKKIDSEQDIKNNGIYLVDLEQIWISVEGCKLNLTEALSGNVYISFMEELPKITPDLKYLALSNAGFFYETLEQARLANLTKGIIYVESEHLLYYINKGIITQYTGFSNQTNKFKEVFIDSLHIFPDFALMIFDSDVSVVFKIKAIPIIVLNKDYIDINNSINIKGDIIGNTYKLYTKNGQSYLEVDNIISKSNISGSYIPELSKSWIYADNIINAISIKNTIVTCETIYSNNYKNGDIIYLQIDNSAELSYKNSLYYLSCPVPVDIVIKVGTQLITIPKNTLLLETSQGSSNFEILLGSEYLKQEGVKNKLFLLKYFVSNSVGNNFDITLPIEDTTFINRCQNIASCISKEDTLLTIDREINFFEKGKSRTKLGNILNIEQLKEPSPQKEDLKYGLFSENLISLNGLFYDPVFKKLVDYPKYDKNIALPQNLTDIQYDSIMPNLLWVKLLINNLLPVGSIIMYNGTTIPEGWAICDGLNGTPDLIGKFIKAGKIAEDIPRTDIDLNNQITITAENLPEHSYSNPTISTVELLMLTNESFVTLLVTIQESVVTDVPNITNVTKKSLANLLDVSLAKGTIQSSHSHTINPGNLQGNAGETQTFANKPIKIEPRAYSLIFIIKLK